MKIVLYTRPSYLDTILPLAYALCEFVEVYLMLEVSPEGLQTNPMEFQINGFPSGVINMTERLEDVSPIPLLKIAQRLSGFHLVVHDTKRAFDPRIIPVWRQASQLIRSLQVDILHFDEVSSRSAPLFFLTMGVPIVLSVHDAKTHPGESVGRAELIRRVLLHQGKGFIFHCQHTRETLMKNTKRSLRGKPIGVIPLGALDIFRRWQDGEKTERSNTILFFGRLSPYKGLEILLEAVTRVAAIIPGLRVLIAGQPITEYTLPQVPVLDNGGEIILRVGHISNKELCNLFQEASVVVLPYIEASQSGVIATAYAFRKPVVVTKIGGLPEMVEDNITGRVIPPGDPESLAQVLIELLNNRLERQRLSENIQKKAENELAWPVLAKATINIYKQVLAASKHPTT